MEESPLRGLLSSWDYAKSIILVSAHRDQYKQQVTGCQASLLSIFMSSAYPRLCCAQHKRGICPSCNARRMAETAAHLVDQVFPPLPARQWVLSVSKRLRWQPEREPKGGHCRAASLPAGGRGPTTEELSWGLRAGPLRGSSFAHRFGAALNRHLHYRILDGVFEPLEAGGAQFRQASAPVPEEVAVIQAQVCRRVLRWFSRHGLLDPDDARDRLAWA